MSEVRDDMPTTSHCSQSTEPKTSHATHADYYRNDIKFRYFKMNLASETRRYNTPKQTLQICW